MNSLKTLSKIYPLLILLLALPFGLLAQQQNVIFSNDYDGEFIISADGSLDIGSNAITSKFFKYYYTGQYIDVDLKEKTFKKLSSKNRMGFDLTYNLKVIQMPDSGSAWGYYAGLNNVLHIDAGFREDLFRVYFAGNKAYAGQTAEWGKSSFQLLSYRQLKGGFIKKGNNSLWGLGLSFIKGDNYLSASLDKGNLFTEQEGAYIDLETQLKVQMSDTGNTKFGDFQGWGLGFDFFYSAQLNEKSKLNFEVTDLGFIAWNPKSITIENDTTIHFEGIEVDNILNIGDSIFSGITTDSILDTLNATSTKGGFSKLIPGYISISYSNQIKEKLALNAGITHRLNANYFPYIYFGTDIKLGEKVEFMGKLSYGGYATLGLGLGMKFDLANFLTLQVASNHIEGYLLPGAATAQGVYVNILAHF